ncbi:hypothetical protein HDU76_007764, partial [Blyttiomyces sp. JEL0837]
RPVYSYLRPRDSNSSLVIEDNGKFLHVNPVGQPGTWKKSFGVPKGPAIPYNGGPVISNVEVFPIFWGQVPYKQQFMQFYTGVVDSTWMDQMSEYNTPNQTIGRGKVIGSYQIDNPPPSTNLNDYNTITPYLRNLVSTGVLKPNANTYYPVHFAPGIAVCSGPDDKPECSCSEFCAYHSAIDISDIYTDTQYLFYGVLVDNGVTSRCFGVCGNTHSVLGNSMSTASHELGEMMTDPACTVATGYPLGWNEPKLGENGDYCNQLQSTVQGGDGNVYIVQQLWSNKAMGCVEPTDKGTKPAMDDPVTPQTPVCHDPCLIGPPLTANCGDCASTMVNYDSYCSQVTWDMPKQPLMFNVNGQPAQTTTSLAATTAPPAATTTPPAATTAQVKQPASTTTNVVNQPAPTTTTDVYQAIYTDMYTDMYPTDTQPLTDVVPPYTDDYPPENYSSEVSEVYSEDIPPPDENYTDTPLESESYPPEGTDGAENFASRTKSAAVSIRVPTFLSLSVGIIVTIFYSL